MCLMQSQEWEERSLPQFLRRGVRLHWGSFQQSDTPIPAKERPPDVLVYSFRHAMGLHGSSTCYEPDAQQEQGKTLTPGTHMWWGR